MAPLVAMVVGSVVRTVITAIGAGAATVGAAPAVVDGGPMNEWQVAIGALLMAVAQIWSLIQKHRTAQA